MIKISYHDSSHLDGERELTIEDPTKWCSSHLIVPLHLDWILFDTYHRSREELKRYFLRAICVSFEESFGICDTECISKFLVEGNDSGSIGYHQLDLSIIRRKYRMYSIRIQQTCHWKFEIYVRHDFSKFHDEENRFFNISDQWLLYVREKKISTRWPSMNVKFQLRPLFYRKIN